jgi:cell division protein FtsN
MATTASKTSSTKTVKSAAAKPVAKPAKAVTAKAAAKPAPTKATTKTATAASKKAAPAKAKVAATKSAKRPAVTLDQRRWYVEVAAYYIAERRNFVGGSPAEDWVQAEAEVDRLLAEGRINP